MNLPSSQIASHLSRAPIKIQSLSLFIGFGSDRQPECRCLFWFHYQGWEVGDRAETGRAAEGLAGQLGGDSLPGGQEGTMEQSCPSSSCP